MTDTFAASLAFLGAGIVLLTQFLPWPPSIEIGIAVLAIGSLIGLGVRRHGYLDRFWGAGLTIVSGMGIIVLSVVAMSAPEARLLAPGIAGMGGLSMIGFGYADYRRIPRDRLLSQLQSTSSGIAIALFGLVGIYGWTVGLTAIAPIVIPDPQSLLTRAIISVLALVLGTLTVAGVVLVASHRSIDFLDYAVPSWTEWKVTFAGAIVLGFLSLAAGVTTRLVGIEPAPHSIVRTGMTDPTLLLVLIPLSLFLVGPSEELLYRNIIQKSLYRSFSHHGAVVVTSVIFAAAHLFAFRSSPVPVLSTLIALGTIYAMSLVLGFLYVRTNNVVVSALAHGLFNAFVFAVTYGQLTMG